MTEVEEPLKLGKVSRKISTAVAHPSEGGGLEDLIASRPTKEELISSNIIKGIRC
jgi:hypothetical protein